MKPKLWCKSLIKGSCFISTHDTQSTEKQFPWYSFPVAPEKRINAQILLQIIPTGKGVPQRQNKHTEQSSQWYFNDFDLLLLQSENLTQSKVFTSSLQGHSNVTKNGNTASQPKKMQVLLNNSMQISAGKQLTRLTIIISPYSSKGLDSI